LNPWVKEEQLRHQLSAEVPRCLPSGKEPPRTEAKDETMERHHPMAEEELGFEGDQMQIDEGSMLRTQSLKEKEHNYWSQDQELQTRCKQPSWKSFVDMNSEQIQQLSVDRRGGDSSVSRGA